MKTPVILQTEMSECGLACLAMIARHHGHDVDLASLRARHLVSMTGASLKSILSIAGTLDLAARPLRLDLEHLPELALPAILHWDLNHYVVLTRVTPTHAHIIDPGRGERKLSLARFGDHFTGIAVELRPTDDFSPQADTLPAFIGMLWSQLTGFKRAVGQTLLLSVVIQIVAIALPVFLQVVVDAAIPLGDNGLLVALALGFGGLVVTRAVAEGARGWAILVYGNQMSLQMVGNVFRHLIHLPTTYFERRHVGDIISRMDSTKPIQEALTQSVVAVLIDGAMAVLMLVVMFVYAPVLAAVVLASVALLALATWVIYPRLRRSQEDALYAKAIENTHVIESIRAATTIKLFGRESARASAWSNLYTDFVNANLDYGKWTLVQKFAESLLIGLQLIVVVYLGARGVMGDGLSLGMLFAFLAYRQAFTDAVRQLIEKGIEFRLLSLHLDRLSDIAFSPREHLRRGEGLAELKGRIELRNVSFRYAPEDPWVVENFSLTIEPGEMVTLTGPSGGGKTTLMKLMLGLYAPTSGEVLIDGKPLSRIGIRDWRARVGVVMQDDQLLSGTILDNITLFDPHPDLQAAAKAAHAARVHTDIMAIPTHYQSRIGNMGSILSGGQRQRVLLARALHTDPKVLFLDEGTANLDAQTESQIVETIAELPITRVIIAHRPAFLEASDRTITIGSIP